MVCHSQHVTSWWCWMCMRWCHYDGGAGGAAPSSPRVCITIATVFIPVVCHSLCVRAAMILHGDIDYKPSNRRPPGVADSLQRWVPNKSSISRPKCSVFEDGTTLLYACGGCYIVCICCRRLPSVVSARSPHNGNGYALLVYLVPYRVSRSPRWRIRLPSSLV